MSLFQGFYSKFYPHFNLITFGRLETPIFAMMALETSGIAVAVFVSDPPFLPLPDDETPTLILALVLTLFLFGFLYLLLAGLGYRTYSEKLHQPRQIFKISVAYVTISAVITYIGYLLLVYPYTETVVPPAADIGVGAVVSAVYAISLVSIFYAYDFFGGEPKSKTSTILVFLSATENLREKPLSEAGSEPRRIIESGRAIQEGLESSDLSDSEKLLTELTDWLDSFEQRNQQGQKKMVGDIPGSETRFSVWNDRYEQLQSIEESLNDMKNHVIYKIVFSTRRRQRYQYD